MAKNTNGFTPNGMKYLLSVVVIIASIIASYAVTRERQQVQAKDIDRLQDYKLDTAIFALYCEHQEKILTKIDKAVERIEDKIDKKNDSGP